MLRSLEAARSQASKQNLRRQAAMYIRFCLLHNVNYFAPSRYDAALFAQYLALHIKSPGGQRNYMSGARTWVNEHGGHSAHLYAAEVKLVQKGAARISPHTPNPAPALTPDHIKDCCDIFDTWGYDGLVYKTATLIGFFAFLRASNIVSPSSQMWGGPHTLLRSSVLICEGKMYITVYTTKTRLPGARPALVPLPVMPSSRFCPAKAWTTYRDMTHWSPSGPAFILSTGAPLTGTVLAKAIRRALELKGYQDAQTFSLHSLRRGGSNTAKAAGANVRELLKHGTWTSLSGLKAYVDVRDSTIPDRFKSVFA